MRVFSPETLVSWAAQAVGGTVARAERLTGGNRRGAVAIDIDTPDGRRHALFLRFDSMPGGGGADPYSLKREAGVYRALKVGPVPIPALRAVHPEGAALLMDRAAGGSAYHAIPEEHERTALAGELMGALATLHGLDATRLDIPELGPVRSITEALAAELAIWKAMYEEAGRPDPLIEAALIWLGEAMPVDETQAVLVHGDAGPGNFMFEAGRLTALIDWELAHLGDPIEDIAWLSMRTVFEPFPDFAGQVRLYEAMAARRVDASRFRYHQVFVALRISIIRHRGLTDPGQSDQANSLISRTMSRRLMTHVMSSVVASPAGDQEPSVARATEMTVYFDYVLDQLKAAAGRIEDKVALGAVKKAARIVKLIQADDAIGPALRDLELRDLTELLGRSPASAGQGRIDLAGLLRNRTIGVADALPYLHRQTARALHLAAPALGAIARRPFPDIG